MAFQGVLSSQQVEQDPQQQLKRWRRRHDFAVCIDTDGCTLDNMWAKHVVVFQPHFMDMNGLRGIEMLFRIHGEHHNLWAKTRGCDRYLAILCTLRSLLQDPDGREAVPRDYIAELIASIEGYVRHVEQGGGRIAFGIPSLIQYHGMHGLDYHVTRLLAWSEAVDRTFRFVTLGMPAFPRVREALEFLSDRADVLVVSATPYSDLAAWWTGSEMAHLVQAIAGKEAGRKADHIRLIKEAGGYADDCVMMVGDGGGDLRAARANRALFYPTPPGRETEAWADATDAFVAFFAGAYSGSLEDSLVAEFEGVLLDRGPWELPGYNAPAHYLELQAKRVATYRRLHPEGKLLILDA